MEIAVEIIENMTLGEFLSEFDDNYRHMNLWTRTRGHDVFTFDFFVYVNDKIHQYVRLFFWKEKLVGIKKSDIDLHVLEPTPEQARSIPDNSTCTYESLVRSRLWNFESNYRKSMYIEFDEQMRETKMKYLGRF